MTLKKGLTADEIFSLICKIRGKNKPIFYSNVAHIRELNKGILPATMQNEFGQKYQLPTGCKVEALSANNKWVIKDVARAIKYVIEKTENKLQVYEKVEAIAHIIVNPVKVGILDIEDEFSDLLATNKKNARLKQLIVRLKQHNNHLQEIIVQFKKKIEELKKEIERERDRKGGFEEIKELKVKILKLEQEKEKAVKARKNVLSEIKQVTSEQVNVDFINKIAKDLQLSPENAVKLFSSDLVEQIVRDRIDGKGNDEAAALVIESGRVAPVIEKGLRDGHFSPQQVQEFVMHTVDPLGKKEVARDLAEQLAKATVLPKLPGYRFSSFYDFGAYPGGDTCLVYPLDFARVAIGLIDLEGSGLAQSCNLFSIKVLFERLLTDYPGDSPDKIIHNLQKEISAIRQSEPKFHCFAGLIGILNCIEHTFSYCRAAAPYIYVYNRDKSKGRFLEHYGVPRIGVQTDYSYYQRPPLQIKLKPSDVLFIQSNGLLDCFGGYENFDSMMEYLPAERIEQFFVEKVQEARNGRPLEDDVYLFAMELLNDQDHRESEN